MKKQIGIAVAMLATLAGGGLALAAEGSDDQPNAPETEDVIESTTTTDDVEVEEVEAPETEEESTEAGEHADNHGLDVSTAAHECPTGAEGVHGECVSAVARDGDGDGTPDHGPGSPDFEAGNGAGHGAGHGDDEGGS